MNAMTLRRWSVVGILGIAAGLLTIVSSCVATGPGYGGEVGVSYGVDYYEPDGYVYDRWQPGYHVAPPRRGREVHAPRPQAERRTSPPVYRPAPSSRPAPTLPSRSRGESRRH